MPRLSDELQAELEVLRAAGLYRSLREVTSAQGREIEVAGQRLLNFSSNDYLGLANHPTLCAAAHRTIDQYGLGAGASRLVCGNLAPYQDLETVLAAFKGKEAALVFGSGYAANVGVISALVGSGDVVILDKLNHASIIDGARQSGATIRVYPHGHLKKLEQLLRGAVSKRDRSGLAAVPTRPRRVLVITETVFSMDGDLALLKEIVALKERFGAWLMIDEAHATGLYGAHRRGLAEPLGVEAQVDVTLGTLSKALGAAGGFVAGSRELIDYLRNRARSLMYSTALPPAVCAAAAAAVRLVMTEEGHHRRDRLWRNVSTLKHGLAGIGIPNQSRSPIIPVIVGDERSAVDLSERLLGQGMFVPAIRFPTVPKGRARLRVTVTADHAENDIQRLVQALAAERSRMKSAPTMALSRGQPVGAVSNRDLAPPHSRQLRKGRVSIPGECYFITSCTEGRQTAFMDPAAARILIDSLIWLRDAGRIRLLGFVIMPDHVHLAFVLGDGSTLPQVMHSWKRHTSQQIRSRIKSAPTGSSHWLWQDGYHDHLLHNRTEFQARLDYLHDNPRRAGLAERAEDYPWSTAHPDFAHLIDWAWLEGEPQ